MTSSPVKHKILKRLMMSTALICLTACSESPTRVDKIPDPRDTPEYKDFLAHGHPDWPIDELIRFKPGRPRAFDTLSSSTTEGSPTFSDLDLFLVLQLHSPNQRITVKGYTDKIECRPDDCQRLSQRRAKLVYDLLLAKGVPRDKLLSPVGYGNSIPVSAGETEEERQRERRVELSMKTSTP